METKDVSLDNFKKYKNTYEETFKLSASIFKQIDFKTNIAKEIEQNFVLKISNELNREKALEKILNYLNDFEKSIYLEAGLFEYSIVYTKLKNLPENLIISVYIDKLNDIILNLDKYSSIKNRYLKKNILNGNISPSEVPFLSPQDIHPKCWFDLEKKKKLREYKKSHMAATDLYKCYKCGESKCKITQLQTRGADEPITNFISCLVCGNTFKQ